MVKGLSKDGVQRILKTGIPSGAVVYVKFENFEQRKKAADAVFNKGHTRLYDLILDANVIAYSFDELRDAYAIAKAIEKKIKIKPEIYKAGSI